MRQQTWCKVGMLAVIGAMAYATTVQARGHRKTIWLSGDFVFAHEAPELDFVGGDECLATFAVDGDFAGTSNVGDFDSGVSTVTGCIYSQPISLPEGKFLMAEYEGDFKWQMDDGSTLSGSYVGYDIADDPTELYVFETVIYITFDGGTKYFGGAQGFAVAYGVDLPFGGGVTASFAGPVNVPPRP